MELEKKPHEICAQNELQDLSYIYNWLSYTIYAFFAVLLLWTLIDLVFSFRKYFLKDIVAFQTQHTQNPEKY